MAAWRHLSVVMVCSGLDHSVELVGLPLRLGSISVPVDQKMRGFFSDEVTPGPSVVAGALVKERLSLCPSLGLG